MSSSFYVNQLGNPLYQNAIKLYKVRFKDLTNNFELPNIFYLGNYSKFNPKSEPTKLFIAIPLKNQECIVQDILRHLINCIPFPFEIGLLFDNCTDKSLEKTKNFFDVEFDYWGNLRQVHLVVSEGDLFESTCENILFEYCKSEFFVSLQADIFINDKAFFSYGVKAFSMIPSLLGVTGRAIVPFKPISKLRKTFDRTLFLIYNVVRVNLRFCRIKYLFPFHRFIAYFGDVSLYPKSEMHFSKKQRKSIYIGEAVIRGPIIWHSEKFRKLGGYNDISFYLGRDDCDLSYRALEYGWSVGLIPCYSFSTSELGTTRKKRSKESEEYMTSRQRLSEKFPGKLSNLWTQDNNLGNFHKIKKKRFYLN